MTQKQLLVRFAIVFPIAFVVTAVVTLGWDVLFDDDSFDGWKVFVIALSLSVVMLVVAWQEGQRARQ